MRKWFRPRYGATRHRDHFKWDVAKWIRLVRLEVLTAAAKVASPAMTGVSGHCGSVEPVQPFRGYVERDPRALAISSRIGGDSSLSIPDSHPAVEAACSFIIQISHVFVGFVRSRVGSTGFVVLLMEVSISYTDASYTVKYYIRASIVCIHVSVLVARLSGPTTSRRGTSRHGRARRAVSFDALIWAVVLESSTNSNPMTRFARSP